MITISDSEAEDLELSLLSGSSIGHKPGYKLEIKFNPNSCSLRLKLALISLTG